jgi:hypothetical protein
LLIFPTKDPYGGPVGGGGYGGGGSGGGGAGYGGQWAEDTVFLIYKIIAKSNIIAKR